nr:hypothetical protein [Tanacetum cinerariifolium]
SVNLTLLSLFFGVTATNLSLELLMLGQVIHTVKIDVVKLVVEIESFGMSLDNFDEETRSSDGLQPKQVDLSYVHALNEIHLHEIRVVPSADNRPPMLEKDIKYSKLSPTDAIQADCDVKATNIILQGLPPEYGSPYQSQQYSVNQSSTPLSITYPSSDYQSSVYQNIYSLQPSIPQLEYAPTVNQQPQQPEFSQLDSSLTVPVFKQGDDPIDVINHMMSFLSDFVTSRYPTTNNQLRNSSNPRKQAIINDERVTLQPVHDKVLLVQAQANGQILHEKELVFLADLGIAEGQATHTVITHNAAYQADDLNAYDANCNELNTAKVSLMENLFHYGSDVLAENAMNSSNPNPSCTPTRVEVPKELPKAVEQHSLEPKTFEVKMNQVLNENERLLEQVINKDIVNIVVNSSVDNASVNVHECKKFLKLETELLNKKDFIEKETYDKLFRHYTILEKHCEKGLIIATLKDELRKLKGKVLVDNVVTTHTIALEMLKIDMEPLAPRLLNNMTAHSDYLRLT